jgi:hypothetical protein
LNSKGDSSGEIKATKRGETEYQESGGSRQEETDTETATKEDADCAWKTSGEIEKGEVPPGTQEIAWLRAWLLWTSGTGLGPFTAYRAAGLSARNSS